MPLSWNEIKSRAIGFSKEWENTTREEADAKEFLIEFLNVFGISRKRVATFEHKVKKLNDADGYIDLLWKGNLLVEMKSRGKDLEKAYIQAKDYCHGLKDYELPKQIIISDFYDFHVYDENGNKSEFTLPRLINHVQVFSQIAGYEKRTYKEQDPVNTDAAELMGKLHDKLKEIGYTGHALELYLVRLLFCLFADDTNIFERSIFFDYIELKTKEDGSDLAMHIDALFNVLNTPNENRLKNLDESLTTFPYVNGRLFEERLPLASFDSTMRTTLLKCCSLDWGKISPAIFGSMFQSVMDEKARRNLGAHYTSEKNILKLIKPLFLDELWKEFESIKTDKYKLKRLHDKISKLRFLDPACGCGNFLIIAYREIRLLELELIKALLKGQQVTSINDYFLVDVDQFYGIEYEEFPAQIAQVAMWLIDHQMNMQASEAFGEYYRRLPLKKSATIKHGNALRIDWQSLLIKESTITVHAEETNIILNEPETVYKKLNVFTKHVEFKRGDEIAPVTIEIFDFILGNPPFIGSKLMTEIQRNDIKVLFHDVEGGGVLDYVTGWYNLAAKYIQDKETKVAFVSTNSVSQGEQAGILWPELLNTYKIKIHFAHQTFKWVNEAKGVAAVYCVIIGFAAYDTNNKRLFLYENIKGEAHEIKVSNINPYLVEGKDITIGKKQNPVCDVPKISFGNMPLDGGNLLLTDDEKNQFVLKEPKATKFMKPLISAYEFLNGQKRWCLWLLDAQPAELREMPLVLERIKKVKDFREASIAPSTQKFALTPTLFRDRQTPETYILIPSTTSENRSYIPLGFFTKDEIANNSCHIIPVGKIYHFGILSSKMHMTWVQYTCGRLKSDYRYSKDIVYNNFPWPENINDKQKETVEKAAQLVLDTRTQFPESSLADLYDPNTMPPALVKAHQQLDKAVDLCYRPQPFPNETKRIEFLFELYDKYTAGLFAKEKKTKKEKAGK